MTDISSLLTAHIAGGGQGVLIALILYVAGMVAYAVFIFKFYRFIARRDVFELELSAYGDRRLGRSGEVLRYVLKYLLLFPTSIIIWYLVFTFFIALLSGEHTVRSVLLVAMAVISATRVSAYYHEKLAEDLSKMIPFAMLGVFVIDGFQALSLEQVKTILSGIQDYWNIILLYWGFTVVLELVLRLGTVARYRTVETGEGQAPTAAEKESEEE